MDETIYVIFKVQFDFALEVWFSIYGMSQFSKFIDERGPNIKLLKLPICYCTTIL